VKRQGKIREEIIYLLNKGRVDLLKMMELMIEDAEIVLGYAPDDLLERYQEYLQAAAHTLRRPTLLREGVEAERAQQHPSTVTP
jgi:hypothetical protein